MEKSAELKAKGVGTIACISVNDAFVMRAWKEDLKINDEVFFLIILAAHCRDIRISVDPIAKLLRN